MKTLTIVLCETRESELTFDLFKKNLLEVLQSDLALCVAINKRENVENPFYKNAKYVWTYEEPEDWGEAFDYAQQINGYSGNWRKLLKIKDQWLGGVKGKDEHPGSASIVLFFRWFLKESLLNSKVLNKYDRFIVTRSDFMHRIPHIPLDYLKKDKIWIPYGEDYGGYTDRHFVAHRDLVIKVLSVTDDIMYNPDKLYSKMSYFSRWNPERFTKFQFKQMNIKSIIRRYPYTMYAVRSKGGHTRWAKGQYDEEHGYYIKYPSEYKRFQIASKHVNKKEDWNKFKLYLIITIVFLTEINLKNTFRIILIQILIKLKIKNLILKLRNISIKNRS